MSSAYPEYIHHSLLSLSIISYIYISATRHHRSGDKTPTCGQPLDTVAHINEPLRAAVASWLSRIATNTVILRYVHGTWAVDGTHQPSTAFVPPLQQSLYSVAEEINVECLARR
jgi:hypothetical protein